MGTNMNKKKKSGTGKDILKGVAILSTLTNDELSIVWDSSHEVKIKAGEVLMNEGEIGNSMYFFIQGEVDISKNLTMKIGRKGFGHAEKSMVKLKAEHVSFFGDMAMFQDEPRSATITAFSDCLLYEINRDEFTKLCDENSSLATKVLRKIADTLCGRVRKGNEDVLKLTTALSIALSR